MFRKNNRRTLLAITILSLFTSPIHAQSNISHVIVAPQCLMKKIDVPYKTLSTHKDLTLIILNHTNLDQVIAAKHRQSQPCGGFIDVTAAWDKFNHQKISAFDKAQLFLLNYATPTKSSLAASHAPYEIKYPTQVNALFMQINPENLWNRLIALSSYQDRYANSENGLQVANEIKSEITQMALLNGRDDVSVYFVPTGSFYKQPSVVAKIGNSTNPGIVIGAHMDTLSGGIFGVRPGADDDGSGTVTVLETARILLSSGMKFEKPLYLIWYSAEELGLIGSQYVVADFKKKNIPISEVIQFDMTGYAYKNDLTMWLIDDYVNTDLTVFLETLIHTYVKQPVKHTACGYACSDNATWTQNGFAASMPAESSFNTINPYIHSSQDTIEKLSLAHMTNFTKLALAFAVELAGPLN